MIKVGDIIGFEAPSERGIQRRSIVQQDDLNGGSEGAPRQHGGDTVAQALKGLLLLFEMPGSPGRYGCNFPPNAMARMQSSCVAVLRIVPEFKFNGHKFVMLVGIFQEK